MSVQKRRQLLHHMDGALDTVLYLLDAEMLTIPEITKLGDIQTALGGVAEKCMELVKEIELRKGKSAEPIPHSPYEGPSFSWSSHDQRVVRKRKIHEARQLEAKIQKLYKQLGECE